jgi:hypothetical protein
VTALPRGTYVPGIANPEVAQALAGVVTGFTHLEYIMAFVMQYLLGDPDTFAGAIIVSALRSPKARIDLLNELLAQWPEERRGKLNPAFADVIGRFISINGRRNNYVHGLWWTHAEDPALRAYLGKIGAGMSTARPVEAKELQDFFEEMNSLWFQIKQMGRFHRAGIPLPEPLVQSDEPKPK